MSRKVGSLAIFEIAGLLNCLKEVVWSESVKEKLPLPSVIVTDNDKALRAAIYVIFPTSLNILCYIHLQRNFEINLMKEVVEKDKHKRDIIKIDIQAMFQKIALTAAIEDQINEAVKEMKEYFLKDGIC
ncbi:hypothetical protein CU097_002079, partial [Rhizopus azygosporus]